MSTSSFNTQPVGTGAFKLVSVDPGQALLRANEQYHLGAPGLAEIQLLFYPDVATAGAAVVSGQAQGVMLDATATAEDLATIADVDGVTSYAAHRTAFAILYLNTEETPLNDAAVRRAIAETVDVNEVIDGILGGRAVRADSPIVVGTWAHNPEVEAYKRDPGSARELLDAAGWVLAENSEVRSRNGIELRMTLLTDQDAARGAIADLVAEDLAEIGMSVTVAREESTELIGNFLIPRQYQASLFGWDPGPDPDPYPAWHSSQASDTGRNLAGYANEEADRLLEEGRRTRDLNERQGLYFAFQDIFREDVPSILLYHPENSYFVTNQIKGLQLGVLFNNSSRFRNVHEWVFEENAGIGSD
jgi:peptide/nickel transport system substrate-binding protein